MRFMLWKKVKMSSQMNTNEFMVLGAEFVVNNLFMCAVNESNLKKHHLLLLHASNYLALTHIN